MTEQRSFEIDDDVFEAGLDGYIKGSGGSGNIWRLKSGEPRKGYFVVDPTPEAKEQGGWLIIREVRAFDGLRGGIELPNGMKEFPVFDQKTIIGEDGVKRRQNDASFDPIMSLVMPGKYGRNGKAKGDDAFMINFLEERADDDGNTEYRHIILKLSGQRGRDLIEAYKQRVEENDDYSFTRYPWTLALKGQGAAAQLQLRPHKADGPTDLPDPIDIRALMGELRESVEQFVNEIQGGAPAALAGDEEAGDPTDDFEGQLDAGDGVQDEEATQFEEMSDAELRKALKGAGQTVPPRAQRSNLIALAVKHLS